MKRGAGGLEGLWPADAIIKVSQTRGPFRSAGVVAPYCALRAQTATARPIELVNS